MCLRFSQISNPVWSDRQVNKWSIELKLMFNCLLLLPSEESESKTQIPIKDILYSLTLELGVVSEWILLLTIFKKIWAWYSAGKLYHNSSLRTWVSNPRSCEGPFLCSWQHQGHPHQAGHLGGRREGGHHPNHGRRGACRQGQRMLGQRPCWQCSVWCCQDRWQSIGDVTMGVWPPVFTTKLR